MDRPKDQAGITAREVSAADRSREERVPGKQKILRCEVKADAPRSMTGRVKSQAWDCRQANHGPVVGALVRRRDFRRWSAQPLGLQIHHGQQREIVLIEKNRRSGRALQQKRSAHVVDVRMSDDDLLHLQAMTGKPEQYLWNVVAGIDDDCLPSFLISEDGAVALQQADREGFSNHDGIMEC